VKRLYQATRRVAGAERCELCAAPLDVSHDHLFEPRARQVRCACRGCMLLIPTSQLGRYLPVPKRFERVEMDLGRWLPALGVPVGVATVVVRANGSAAVAFPGPAGLVECEVDAPLWDALRAAVPALATLTPEVESLVCSTLPGGGAWIAGIDVVFEMVAAIRQSWRGLTGGPEAPAAVARVIASHVGGAA
jgi:hypothetical protein